MPGQDYYVWYRVGQADRDTETAVRSMMGRLACRSGISGRLLKKRDEPRLWMEAYPGVADPARFERLMAQVLDELDVEMFLDGPRRMEVFLPDDPVPAACTAAPHPTDTP
ncbi:MAG: DUF4936 family protein [Pseudomonadota bacterium]